MTRILMLQQPSSTSPVDRWLADADPSLDIRMISGAGTKRPDSDLASVTKRVLAQTYASAEVIDAAYELCAGWRPDRVLSNAEADVMRAAELRWALNVPGLRPQLAVKFRDKIAMKDLFRAAGLATAPAVAVQCAADVESFIARAGTTVLKPRRGMAAAGVHVLDSVQSLRRALRSDPSIYDQLLRLELMAEQFVAGDVFHVDATVAGAELAQFHASRYDRPPHLFAERNLVSVLLDEGSADLARLREATIALVAALGPNSGVHVLHFEVYRTAEGEYIAGEVACRLGGGLIKAAIKAAAGLDMSRETYLLSAGLPGRTAPGSRRTGAGFVLFTASPAPEFDADCEWLRDCFRHEAMVGRTAAHSVDASGGAVVLGADAADVLARIRALETPA